MPVEHVALLQIQRDLHDIPRGMERFEAYLKAIVNDERDDVRYAPMVAMNPMGREHVAQRLDELLAMDAEIMAEQAIEEAQTRSGTIEGTIKHALVILDDIGGGWTNRTTVDAAGRFGLELPLKRPWLSTGWWVSEAPTPQRVRQAVLMTMRRVVYVAQHGSAVTLHEKLVQEGTVSAFSGLQPTLDAEELDYTRHVIAPYRASTDYSIHIAALYGDQAARALGYEPLGLSANAGFELALADETNPL
ncbi:MAG: hypothetical protein CL610_01890 [Anaerolineaceae bacterium]|nr:hypothetical protein [Anaerolineaceae bacterium]